MIKYRSDDYSYMYSLLNYYTAKLWYNSRQRKSKVTFETEVIQRIVHKKAVKIVCNNHIRQQTENSGLCQHLASKLYCIDP